ncbi:hypothetical protein HOI26_03450 [Candidatus Woesearchaeota archaeon]|jgi:intein/homing endonuclease|nr:hypothetical protein [Candidatus Woesearchaeota archaeon]MBT5740131.1 hypothetical protein [Candidatus Woesearchaeota archaeon]
MKITPELAEIFGIHVGDGYLRYHGRTKELDISGSYEEKSYYDNHMIPLFNKTFNLKIEGKYFPSRKTYGFVVREPEVIEIFKQFGFPSGKKSTIIKVPDCILYSNSKKIVSAFLRGYFDTDGCLTFRNRKGKNKYSAFKKKFNYYPRILLISVSKDLIEDIKKLLVKFDFKYYTCVYQPKNKNWNDVYRLRLLGNRNLIKWMMHIGTKNPVKLSRYEIWENYGFCPTNTTFNQRINILAGKINPYGPVM